MSDIPGYKTAVFAGGTLDGQTRVIKLPLERGRSYIKVLTQEQWMYDVDTGVFILREAK